MFEVNTDSESRMTYDRYPPPLSPLPSGDELYTYTVGLQTRYQ